MGWSPTHGRQARQAIARPVKAGNIAPGFAEVQRTDTYVTVWTLFLTISRHRLVSVVMLSRRRLANRPLSSVANG